MIKETFIALKAIGVSDAHTIDMIEAMEGRHQFVLGKLAENELAHRADMHEMKRDIAVLKWAMAIWPTIIFGAVLTILFRVFSK